jgi:hypothetical protein
VIREFAVEPEVMATWQHFRELWEDFGAGKGRLAALYPSDWTSRVSKLAQTLSPPVRAASVAAKLQHHPHKFVAANRPFDKGKDWLRNAEEQKPGNEFSGIIARKNPRDLSRVLVAGEFPKDQPPYASVMQGKVPRTAEAIAACARLLLVRAEELILVDRNFDPSKPQFCDPLLKLLSPAGRLTAWRRCELHTAAADLVSSQPNRAHNFAHYLKRALPNGSLITVHFWQRRPGGEKLHARYLLTELGGLQFDYGLDTGEPGETTVVTLLDHSLWVQLREDYRLGSATFVPAQGSPIQVVG